MAINESRGLVALTVVMGCCFGVFLACGRRRFGAVVVEAMGKRQAAVTGTRGLALASGAAAASPLGGRSVVTFGIGCDRPLGAWVSPAPGHTSDLQEQEVV
jgi:hypothetical protein